MGPCLQWQDGVSFGQAPPNTDGPASAAIWANCRVSDDDGDLPTASSLLASSTHFVISSSTCTTSLMGEELLAGEGWCTGEGGHFSSTFSFLTHLASRLLLSPPRFSPPPVWLLWQDGPTPYCMCSTILPSLSLVGLFSFSPCYSKNEEKRL